MLLYILLVSSVSDFVKSVVIVLQFSQLIFNAFQCCDKLKQAMLNMLQVTFSANCLPVTLVLLFVLNCFIRLVRHVEQLLNSQ